MNRLSVYIWVVAVVAVAAFAIGRVSATPTQSQRLDRACIPTDTGGGVTQCLQPTVFDTNLEACIQSLLPYSQLAQCVRHMRK